MNEQSSRDELQFDELKNVVLDTIRKEGLLKGIEAEIREVVHKVLSNKEHPREEQKEGNCNEQNLLINQLITDYLRFNNYKHTLSVFQSEANIREPCSNGDAVSRLEVNSSEANKASVMLQLSRSVLLSRNLLHPNNVRNLRVSAIRCDIFKVQDEDDFNNKVRNSKVPVVVDFYADWCGPCKLLTPRLETIIGDQKGKVDLAKVDVDSLDSIAAEFQVASVPSVFAMKDGKVVDKFIGLQDEDKIRAFVDKLTF